VKIAEIFRNLKEKGDEVEMTLIKGICEEISSRCMENLEAFNGVAAKYRMTDVKTPTKPSNFTASIFRPLTRFFHNSPQNTPTQLKISQIISQDVFQRFSEIIKEILISTKKTEEILKSYQSE